MPSDAEINETIARLKREGAKGGYNLNPNLEDLKIVIDGYLVNEKKYGYPSCPCRVAAGDLLKDRDIVCPCDYRDADVSEHGACYCSLYVDDDIAAGKKQPHSIPERRGKQKKAVASTSTQEAGTMPEGSITFMVKTNIWRCTVCGYLCAKDEPPPKCPICGVKKDRFELVVKVG